MLRPISTKTLRKSGKIMMSTILDRSALVRLITLKSHSLDPSMSLTPLSEEAENLFKINELFQYEKINVARSREEEARPMAELSYLKNKM